MACRFYTGLNNTETIELQVEIIVKKRSIMKVTGLVSMIKNRWNREAVYSRAEYWDSKASELEGDAVSMWTNISLNCLYHIEHMKLVTSTLTDLRGKKVLDVGCGTGYMSRYLATNGAKVTAIDFSAKTLELAEQESRDLDITYKVQSVFDINTELEYDLVFMWGCSAVAAKDASELTVILDNLYRSLKDDGQILIMEPIHKGFLHFVLNMKFKRYCELVTKSGFNIQSTQQLHFWPGRLGLAYINWPKFITTPLYHVGQLMMRFPIFNGMGDYKAIFAHKGS